MNFLLRSTIAAFALWGFGLSAHAVPIAGSSSGIFENPIGPGGMQVTGVGTNSFTWGDGTAFNSPPSSLQFNGLGFDTDTGSFFDVGTVTYFNGTIAAGTEATSVDLAIELSFTNPVGVIQSFNYVLSLINTPNTGTPNQNADIVQFPGGLPTQSFDIGGTLYTLGLEVGTVSGSGFSTQDTFAVLEGQSATATLRGLVTIAAVPEPGTLSLIVAGLLGLAFARRKKTV